jgi:putative ABC transport system permease protein
VTGRRGRPAPPRAAEWLLRRALPGGLRGDTIRGDLLEEFNARARGAPRRVTYWYWVETLALVARYGLARRRSPVARPDKRTSIMDGLLQDLRYGLRMLRQAPGFTAAALATLMLGIGASTAIFSIVDAVLLRPLPFEDPDRLVFATELSPRGERMSVAWPNFIDWRARLRSVEDLAATRGTTFTFTGDGAPQRLDGRQMTWNLLRVLGVHPARGRAFAEAEDRPGDVHPVLISHELWTARFGADQQIVGRHIRLDDRPHAIVGVLPPGFRFMRHADVYEALGVAMTAANGDLDRGNHRGIAAVGRLRPGVDADAARVEVQALAAALAREYPATNSGNSAQLRPLAAAVVGEMRLVLLVLLGAVGTLLLIACTNVAGLLVARGAARQHELAVRAALGCGRLRLVRQLLAESTLLSLLGGALGVLVAWWLVQMLVGLAPAQLPRLDEVKVDGRALLFALASAGVCGLLFGAFPALQASGIRGQHLLVRASRTAALLPAHRLRRGLLIVEMALAVILLTGAGLMMRTMQRLTAVDTGFDPSNLLTLRLSLEGDGWSAPRRVVFYDELLGRVRALPGVADAALTLSLPIAGSEWGSVFMVGDKPVPLRAELPSAAFTPVSPRYFETLRMTLVAGRLIDPRDREGSRTVAVVNQTFARRFWPNESAIGKRLKQGWPEWETPWHEIVGVVRDVKFDGVAVETPMQVYLPIAQVANRSLALVVRSDGRNAGLLPSIETTLHAIAPDVPVYAVRTMDELMEAAVARERVSAVILIVFAAVAIVLAAVGLYGLISHGVTERVHEIGVRMALGADRRDVVRLFVRQGLATALAGTALGVAAALGLVRFIKDLLFGVEPADPMTFAAVVAGLAVIAAAASYLPARRATRVNPVVALRME